MRHPWFPVSLLSYEPSHFQALPHGLEMRFIEVLETLGG